MQDQGGSGYTWNWWHDSYIIAYPVKVMLLQLSFCFNHPRSPLLLVPTFRKPETHTQPQLCVCFLWKSFDVLAVSCCSTVSVSDSRLMHALCVCVGGEHWGVEASSKVSPPEWGGQRATVVRFGHLRAVMNMDALRLQEVLPCCDNTSWYTCNLSIHVYFPFTNKNVFSTSFMCLQSPCECF